MTQGEFRARLKALRLTLQGFAMLTGLNYKTVQGWGAPRHGRGLQEVPKWACLLLTLMGENRNE